MKKNKKRFEVTSNKKYLTYTLTHSCDTFVTTYDVSCLCIDEWEDLSYNTQQDWLNYIRTEQVTAYTELR